MSSEVELLSFIEIARCELGNDSKSTKQFPEKIRNFLNTIFTKKDNVNLYRPKVINEKVTDIKQNKHPIQLGKKHFVYNVLVIWYLFNSDTGKTKCLLQEYAEFGVCNSILGELIKSTEKQYFEFFCLGVVRENLQSIIECLKSPEFDLFTKKLPSPFSLNGKSIQDISPMLIRYSEDVPWKNYLTQYQIAEGFFENKDYMKAKETLLKLEEIAGIRLPIVEALKKNINAVEQEAKEAWDYFQKILS